MSVPVLPMHQDLCLTHRIAHVDNCVRLFHHSEFHLFKKTLEVGAFLIVRDLVMHVTKTFVPTPIFDGQADLETLHRVSQVIVLRDLHVWDFKRFSCFWISCNEHDQCVSNLLPFLLVCCFLKYIYLDHQSWSLSHQHISTHPQILFSIKFADEIDPVNRDSN